MRLGQFVANWLGRPHPEVDGESLAVVRNTDPSIIIFHGYVFSVRLCVTRDMCPFSLACPCSANIRF